jgi:hypothetical protein
MLHCKRQAKFLSTFKLTEHTNDRIPNCLQATLAAYTPSAISEKGENNLKQ